MLGPGLPFPLRRGCLKLCGFSAGDVVPTVSSQCWGQVCLSPLRHRCLKLFGFKYLVILVAHSIAKADAVSAILVCSARPSRKALMYNIPPKKKETVCDGTCGRGVCVCDGMRPRNHQIRASPPSPKIRQNFAAWAAWPVSQERQGQGPKET